MYDRVNTERAVQSSQVRDSQVGGQIGGLEKEVAGIESLIDALTSRLQPVLSPVVPAVSGGAGDRDATSPMPNLCPIGTALYMENHRLSILRGKLEQLLNDLEV